MRAVGTGSSPSVVDQASPDVMDDEFVAKVFPSLHRAAWRMTGDASAAEDLAQETLIVAMRTWNTFQGRSSRSTWLHGILIQLTRKHFRSLARFRRRIERYVGLSGKTETQPDSAEAVASEEWRQSIWSQVQTLPRHQAEAITLRYGQQLTYDEIAAAVGCAVGTAKSRVHEGIKRLRQMNHDIDETLN